MNTFVTYRGFARTAASLDMQRLGKQRLETLQILRALRHETDTYANHPAVYMWEGHEEALVYYGLVITHEWRIMRGFKDNTWGTFAALAEGYGMLRTPEMVKGDQPVEVVYPAWLGEDWVLRSHRSNLIRKLPHHYEQEFGVAPDNMPYLWPVWDKEHPDGYWLRVSYPDLDRLKRGERKLPRQVELVNEISGEVRITE